MKLKRPDINKLFLDVSVDDIEYLKNAALKNAIYLEKCIQDLHSYMSYISHKNGIVLTTSNEIKSKQSEIVKLKGKIKRIQKARRKDAKEFYLIVSQLRTELESMRQQFTTEIDTLTLEPKEAKDGVAAN